MRKFLFFVLMLFGISSFGDELSLVQSFKFDGSIFYKKNTAKDESFYFLKNENFDGGNFAPMLLGSVVINLDLVELKAAQLGHGRDDETALLFTHGLLHVLGYDHESDDGQMRAKECEIIEKFRLPKSLIVRTERNEE